MFPGSRNLRWSGLFLIITGPCLAVAGVDVVNHGSDLGAAIFLSIAVIAAGGAIAARRRGK
jgi:hypothetical protein